MVLQKKKRELSEITLIDFNKIKKYLRYLVPSWQLYIFQILLTKIINMYFSCLKNGYLMENGERNPLTLFFILNFRNGFVKALVYHNGWNCNLLFSLEIFLYHLAEEIREMSQWLNLLILTHTKILLYLIRNWKFYVFKDFLIKVINM